MNSFFSRLPLKSMEGGDENSSLQPRFALSGDWPPSGKPLRVTALEQEILLSPRTLQGCKEPRAGNQGRGQYTFSIVPHKTIQSSFC